MTPGDKHTGPMVVTMGELLIDFVGKPKGTPMKRAETFERKPGGAPANVAVGLARLGTPSGFVGMVGNDAFGEFLRETIANEGVDVRGVVTCMTQPTTLAFVSIDEKGVPDFVFYRHPGADLSLLSTDVNEAVFESARVFHFGSLSLVASPAREATFHCLKLAQDRGMFVSYDPNYRARLWPDQETGRKGMLLPIERVNLLKVSEDELRLLAGVDKVEAACESIAQRGPRCIVVTRGAAGLLGWCSGEMLEVPGRRVNVVDTTGCGDSSMAGVLAQLLRAYPDLRADTTIAPGEFRRALEFANRCAAFTATKFGAIPALPTRADLE